MSKLNGFTFFRSYYESIYSLEIKDRNEMLDAIFKYIFEDKEPKFNGIKKTFWMLIEPNLRTSKNRSNKNSGAPQGNQNARKNNGKTDGKEKQSKNNQKTIKKQSMASLSLSYSLSNSISYSNSNIKNNNIINNLFIEYIKLREYKNYILNESVIKRLIRKIEEIEDVKQQEEIIEKAIINGWKDFYPIEDKKGGEQNGTEYRRI